MANIFTNAPTSKVSIAVVYLELRTVYILSLSAIQLAIAESFLKPLNVDGQLGPVLTFSLVLKVDLSLALLHYGAD